MGIAVTEEIIKNEKPDAIIIATGSKPFAPPIKGIDGANVVTAEDVLNGICDINPGPVVVCGGGEVGGETAEFITLTNQDVTVLEMRSEILADMFFFNRLEVMDSLARRGVKVITNATVSEIAGAACIIGGAMIGELVKEKDKIRG